MMTPRDMVAIPGGVVELGLTVAEADRLAHELATMEQIDIERRVHLHWYYFSFDETLAQRRAWLETSMPVQRVEVGDLAIDRYPVTVGQYAEFVEQTGAARPDLWVLTQPDSRKFVTGLSWREATAYAEHYGLRLPTEAEWELAARRDRRLFTWGDAYYPLGPVAFPDHSSHYPWVVGSRGELASPWGVHDLIGEFGEYTCEPFAPYPGTDKDLFEQHFPEWRSERAVRGGYDVYQDSTCVYRNGIGEDDRASSMKFRCVRAEPVRGRSLNR
ncbi:MAG: formylglycine-generating enzyme family protein [Planctomycetota bacterium]|jgi:formylglycine-generating enzyme required for sulfatase activity